MILFLIEYFNLNNSIILKLLIYDISILLITILYHLLNLIFYKNLNIKEWI